MSLKKIELKGITSKGKQRVKRDGSEWYVVREEDSVAFSTEHGPWLLIDVAHVPDSNISNVARWVHKTNDKDFKVSYE